MVSSHSSLTNEFLSLSWQPKLCLQKISESRINSSCQTQGPVETVGGLAGLLPVDWEGAAGPAVAHPSALLSGGPRDCCGEALESDRPTSNPASRLGYPGDRGQVT